MSAVEVTVKQDGKEKKIWAEKTHTLLETLQKEGIFLRALCAGRGTCGKCGVHFLEASPAPADRDRAFFTRYQLEEGWRLACCTFPEKNCIIELPSDVEKNFAVLSDDIEETRYTTKKGEQAKPKDEMDVRYGIAVDIGTTTLAMMLINMETKSAVDTFTDINRQRAFGADVISRIEASYSGKKKALRKCIQKQLLKGIRVLTCSGKRRVSRMVIAGNTTMIHLLMGYSCETLGRYPFTPVNIKTIHTSYRRLFENMVEGLEDWEIVICPGISTYVGGDIVSGIYELSLSEEKKPCVLVDLGTNGEMAVGCRNKILCASTAAGPAFEGGNIVCGTGSIPGAVCSVERTKKGISVQTIDDAPPCGICGTGVVEAISELKDWNIIDENGLMEEAYFEEGFLLSEENGGIRLFQKDVREFQLAKAAVRAGFETLLLKYGISWEEIERIYIAGGFGYSMNIRKAVNIGLFPEGSEDKVIAAGNTSLRGAARCLLDYNGVEKMESIVDQAEEIQLSGDQNFQEYYMEYIGFS